MKKKLVMLFTVILLVSVFVAAYPVLTSPVLTDDARMHDDDDVLTCEMFIKLNWDWMETGVGPSWIGTVSGDIEGDICIFLYGAYFDYPYEGAGIWEVFWEEWVIMTHPDTITILNAGVWSFETFKFQSAGAVVTATEEWECLIGSTIFASGMTTEFPVPSDTPVNGTATMWIDFEDAC